MDFVRTHINTNQPIPLSFRGIIPPTTDCNGSYISQERGMDGMCCAKCSIVRQQIYREKGSFITNKLCIDYLYRLREQLRDCTSACILTTCGKPLLYIPPSNSDLEANNVREVLKQQFLLLRELHLVDIVDTDNIGYTQMGIPIIFPSNDCVLRKEYGGDEGITIENNVLSVIDGEKAFASGKWSYLVGYYTTLRLLYGIREKMVIFH